MPSKSGAELDRLTKVAERLFILYSKGVRFSVNDKGNLGLEYFSSYRIEDGDRDFLELHLDRVLFLLPFWRVKLFHSMMNREDIDFLQSCNINLELSEDSELRTPVVLPPFETAPAGRQTDHPPTKGPVSGTT